MRLPGMGADRPEVSVGAPGTAARRAVADNLGEYLASIRDRETALLGEAGNGSWEAWVARLAPIRDEASALLESQPASVMAFKGRRGFLLFRRELEYLLAGDLQTLPPDANPLETISSLRDSLASLGIDFLFVPIPTKQDVYPAILSEKAARPHGGAVQPYFRKVLLDLSERGIETVDLLSLFRDEARSGDETLYQRQDTHWTSRGLAIAAGALAERVMSYAWFGEAYPEEIFYTTRDTDFVQLGDLYDRLPAAQRAGLEPERLRASRVFSPGGEGYEVFSGAPVLVLGDSYTGVFELTGCRHAGVTAHLARTIGGPVDLIMGWGGGPEAPGKLRRAGPEVLQGKRLVIWMMSVRDLFVPGGGWDGRDG
jgi:alginate O-acetyltransferase complex protein AlgJ